MSAQPVAGAVYDALTGGLRAARQDLDEAIAALHRVPGMGEAQSARHVAVAITQARTARMWVALALEDAAREFTRAP